MKTRPYRFLLSLRLDNTLRRVTFSGELEVRYTSNLAPRFICFIEVSNSIISQAQYCAFRTMKISIVPTVWGYYSGLGPDVLTFASETRCRSRFSWLEENVELCSSTTFRFRDCVDRRSAQRLYTHIHDFFQRNLSQSLFLRYAEMPSSPICLYVLLNSPLLSRLLRNE